MKSTTVLAPSAFNIATSFAVPVAITRIPCWLASWVRNWPTPPVAPTINTVSPAFSALFSKRSSAAGSLAFRELGVWAVLIRSHCAREHAASPKRPLSGVTRNRDASHRFFCFHCRKCAQLMGCDCRRGRLTRRTGMRLDREIIGPINLPSAPEKGRSLRDPKRTGAAAQQRGQRLQSKL